ncbi:Metallo-dependent phosphatase-like protein [Fomitopsis serialis]|uniref:Metallo-dependent phosphatase-like protein n=1 Tax=Fomitopsis serialis TaxID=139415 RepID=UPI00200806F1|nr:Metallo-dependent phosphatase-like protein [Neoantrodia serialis]KAH9924870.1 Metallo-dependent phosphatase-like protein [Neoantrodia serialis]
MYRTRLRLGVSNPYDVLLDLLHILWVAAVSFNETGTFRQHVKRCKWPDAAVALQRRSSEQHAQVNHVLLVADPQLLDSQSYPGRNPWLVWLSQLMVDLNMRKSWRASLALHPDAVVFLGDMMDNGRMDQSDDEYERYFQRFRQVFRTDEPVPTQYIPGNHDVGLGASTRFSQDAAERYVSHFGPLNQLVELGDHTFVLIDAPGLVAEEGMRLRSGRSYSQWVDVSPTGVIAFIHSLAVHEDAKPRVLFTHIPLARPEDAPCGPLRERGTIHQGKGFGYQNTLAPHTTEFVLQHVRPSLVFSGDDHDYCDYTHTYGSSDVEDTPSTGTVQEITVKSFSMAMGIRQPGFQLLSVGTPPSNFTSSLATVPCLLPDQLGIYINVYVPLFVFSVALLLASNIHRVRTRGRYVNWVALPRWCQCLRVSVRFVLFGRRMTLRLPSISEQPCDGDDVELGGNRPSVGRGSTVRAGGALGGAVRDVVNVAWMPLLLFVGLAWWVF